MHKNNIDHQNIARIAYEAVRRRGRSLVPAQLLHPWEALPSLIQVPLLHAVEAHLCGSPTRPFLDEASSTLFREVIDTCRARSTLLDALYQHFTRYQQRLDAAKEPVSDIAPELSNEHLHWMCSEAMTHLDWPDDKLNRWLGYIQGVMAMKGIIDVNEERAFSRPLFHAVYAAQEIPLPATLADPLMRPA